MTKNRKPSENKDWNVMAELIFPLITLAIAAALQSLQVIAMVILIQARQVGTNGLTSGLNCFSGSR